METDGRRYHVTHGNDAGIPKGTIIPSLFFMQKRVRL